jgi:hypothetical protein
VILFSACIYHNFSFLSSVIPLRVLRRSRKDNMLVWVCCVADICDTLSFATPEICPD